MAGQWDRGQSSVHNTGRRFSLTCNNKDSLRIQSPCPRPNPSVTVCKLTRVPTKADWMRQTRPDQTRPDPNPEENTKMSEPTNYLELTREVDMQPTPPPPPMADFNMLHEQVT